MAKKFRSAESYYGNTKKARERQRSNLVGGNIYRKRQVSELRFDCWWEVMPLESRQEIFEARVNGRFISTYLKKYPDFQETVRISKAKYGIEYVDIPKEKLKDKKYLVDWWGKQEFEEKKYIYKNDMAGYDKKTRNCIFNDMEKCLKEKLALLEKDF